MKSKLILLHGALASEKQFDRLKPLLNSSFDLHSLNFEGHGGRPVERDFSINHFAQNLLDYLEEKALENVLIFGYSMGGYVALKAALTSERIAKIVTLATKFEWGKESTAKEVRMLNPEGIEANVPHYAESLKNEHAPANWKEVVRQTAIMMTRLSEDERLTTEDLGRIEIPVMIGIGDQDKMVSVDESAQAASRLTNADICILEGVQHPLGKMPLEKLEKYIRNSFS